MAERCFFKAGDCVNGRYEIEKSLGEGSFGIVFRVKDTADGQVRALKIFKFWELAPDARTEMHARSQMEFETGQIDSNYLVRSVAIDSVKGNPFIVMEYCPNGDLKSVITGHQKIDLIKTGREILYGLSVLHQNGKVHRDLKPENVLIKTDGTAALTDFGISGDRAKRLTALDFLGRPKDVMGTVIYMAPEQVKPKNREVTVLPTMDIFAFGVMMYVLITGVFPFGPLINQNDLALYIKNAREGNWNRKILSDHKDGAIFNKAIAGCLTPDFKQRLQTVELVLSLFPRLDDSTANIETSFKEKAIEGILLRVMQGEEYGSVYKLKDLLTGKGKIVTIGHHDSDVNNTLPLIENFSRYISRKHCTMELIADNQWYIRDGQWDKNAIDAWKRSLNGTYVNSSEVDRNGMLVQPGDIITIGDVKLRVEGY